ncbi:MAG: hypothetical protein IJ681_05265 [Bacteroidales bacterium]|nr:hypothetical protein [Bacteroidales bacterium]
MKHKKNLLATLLLCTAGTFTFVSCTDEDDVPERSTLSKNRSNLVGGHYYENS